MTSGDAIPKYNTGAAMELHEIPFVVGFWSPIIISASQLNWHLQSQNRKLLCHQALTSGSKYVGVRDRSTISKGNVDPCSYTCGSSFPTRRLRSVHIPILCFQYVSAFPQLVHNVLIYGTNGANELPRSAIGWAADVANRISVSWYHSWAWFA